MGWKLPCRRTRRSATATPDHEEQWKALHEAVRAHELELNRATSAFEHALLAPLTLLNGGAAAAWLTFVGNRTGFDPGIGAWRIWGPALAWAAGLGLAVWAIQTGWERQRRYATAERWRREALEVMWLQRADGGLAEATIVLTALGLQEHYGGYDRLEQAVAYVDRGDDRKREHAGEASTQDEEQQRRDRATDPRPLPPGAGDADEATERWLAPRLLAAAEHERGKQLANTYKRRVQSSTTAFFVGAFCAILAVSSATLAPTTVTAPGETETTEPAVTDTAPPRG